MNVGVTTSPSRGNDVPGGGHQPRHGAGISAPADGVAGAADGTVQLNVTLSAPGVSPLTVNYATTNGTTAANTSTAFCAGSNI